MERSPKCSLLIGDKDRRNRSSSSFFFVLIFTLCVARSTSQTANFVRNGSFEDLYDCNGYSINKVEGWMSIDSIGYGAAFPSYCNNKAPLNASGFQHPRTGSTYVLSTWYSPNHSTYQRGYIKNRLKKNLVGGKSYCVKLYVSIANESYCAIDGIGAFFGDNTLDTIKYYNVPLSYINPQVKNPSGNIISDTLGWTLMTGTFVANGSEKYALLGNFLANNAVTTSSISGPCPATQGWTDVYIDDVSCIELTLPAFAGRDTTFAPGDSIFLGRIQDVGINEAFIWYKLPGNVPIDTIAGLWAKPSETCTYVVRQEICGLVKWDTVTLYLNAVGLPDVHEKNRRYRLFPNPTENKLTIESTVETDELTIIVSDISGRVVETQQISTRSFIADLQLKLPNGAYLIKIHNRAYETVSKMVFINK